MFTWKSIKETEFELDCEELFIKCGFGEMGGIYMCVRTWLPHPRILFCVPSWLPFWLYYCPLYMLSEYPILSWAALIILAFNQQINWLVFVFISYVSLFSSRLEAAGSQDAYFFFSFFFFWQPPPRMEFPGQGSDPSCTCTLLATPAMLNL